MRKLRVAFLVVGAMSAPLFGAEAMSAKTDRAEAPKAAVADVKINWHDVTKWGVEGRAWPDERRLRYFDRLPADAEEEAKHVLDYYKRYSLWDLSRCSAGMMVRFRTDSTSIRVKYRLYAPDLSMAHMPATGMSGVDLYARDEKGTWRYVMTNKPNKQDMDSEVISGMSPGTREFALYLPLYNGVDSMEIGVPDGAMFEGLAPREKPIVFYGTSITQGGVASRPGMAHVAILGRRLDRPTLNLGFSGNGKMDPVIGRFLTRVDASVFVIDCSGNMQPDQIRERCVPLVHQLRAAWPKTPIVLAEDRGFPNAWIIPKNAKYVADNHAALRESYERLKKEGVSGIYYAAGDTFYGADSEGSADNSHASDLGFMRMAEQLEPVLREALQAR